MSSAAALLGEMEKVNGKITVGGSIAYVSQQAWIVNDTLKDNVTFNNSFDQGRWRKCVEVMHLLLILFNYLFSCEWALLCQSCRYASCLQPCLQAV